MDQPNKNQLISTLTKLPLSLWEEGWGTITDFFNPSGLSVSEDDQNVFVEAQLPGLKQDDIQINMDENILWIKGEKKEEKTDKRYFQKASSTFSYKLSLPRNIDPDQEPEAKFENGELKITFKKIPEAKKTKQIQIKK